METFEAGFKLLIFCTGEVRERPGPLCQVIILIIIGIIVGIGIDIAANWY